VLQLHRPTGDTGAASGCRSAAVPRPSEAPLAPVALPPIVLTAVGRDTLAADLAAAVVASGAGEHFGAERWAAWRGGGVGAAEALVSELKAVPPPAGRTVWLIREAAAAGDVIGLVEATPGPLQDRGTVRVAVAVVPAHRRRHVGVAALRGAIDAVWAAYPEANRVEVVVPARCDWERGGGGEEGTG